MEPSDIYMSEGSVVLWLLQNFLPQSTGMRYNELMDFYRKYRKVW